MRHVTRVLRALTNAFPLTELVARRHYKLQLKLDYERQRRGFALTAIFADSVTFPTQDEVNVPQASYALLISVSVMSSSSSGHYVECKLYTSVQCAYWLCTIEFDLLP